MVLPLLGAGPSSPGAVTPAVVTLDSDDFDRSVLNHAYTKSASNPLTATGYGDPFVWLEGGTQYLFANDLTNLDIDLATATDFVTFGSFSQALAPGGASEWDERHVKDCSIVKVGSTYEMYFNGQKQAGATGSDNKIGRATATAIDGTWTKYGSNPVMSRASEGMNESSVLYDASDTPKYRQMVTVSAIAGVDEVGPGDFGYFSSADGISWTDNGDVFSESDAKDAEVIEVVSTSGQKNWAALYNDTDEDIYLITSSDFTTWSNRTLLLSRGAASSYDELACFAPGSIFDSGTIYTYYQAKDGSNDFTIALATADQNILRRWIANGGTWTCDGSILQYTAGSSWDELNRSLEFTPSYTVTCKIRFVTTGAGFSCGLYVGTTSIGRMEVVFKDASNEVELRENGTHYGTASVPNGISTGTWYQARAKVQTGRIQVDWHDGSSWNEDVINTTLNSVSSTLDFTKSNQGVVAHSSGTTDYDDYSVTEGV